MRRQRRTLGDQRRADADAAIAQRVRQLAAFKAARRIGVYLEFDGEASVARLIRTAELCGKTVYAPVLDRRGMHFARIGSRKPMARNFFGILEPAHGRRIDARRLDLVLTPLVAFDTTGTRIGVGRAYYDRCFRFLRGRRIWRRPKLLGIAYGFQCVAAIERLPWDVPLWGAVTESDTLVF